MLEGAKARGRRSDRSYCEHEVLGPTMSEEEVAHVKKHDCAQVLGRGPFVGTIGVDSLDRHK